MIDKKMSHAITSLAFNQKGNLLAVSSYSSDQIEVYSTQDVTFQKNIKLTNGYNPLNSLVWTKDYLISIDDEAKKISFIDYLEGKIIHQFSNEHVRGFESIDHIELSNKNLILAASKKIHPPTIEKLNLDIDHKDLNNLFIIDIENNEHQAKAIPGNLLQAKFINHTDNFYSIIAVTRDSFGTKVILLDSNLNLIKEYEISKISAEKAFIAVSNFDISIVCHLNQKYEKTVYASYDIRDFKLITLISSSETKFETKLNSYLNSVFSYKNKKLLEKYLRNDHSSLEIFDIKSDEIFFNSNSYGFMEAVAFTDNYVALSENNTLKVVKI